MTSEKSGLNVVLELYLRRGVWPNSLLVELAGFIENTMYALAACFGFLPLLPKIDDL